MKRNTQKTPWWLDILYEDNQILLVNKPPGLIVHPNDSERRNTLVHHVRDYLRRTGAWNAANSAAFRPMPCNRLDRFTGGIVIFAKTWEAMREMNRQLQARRIEKKYLCVVVGRPCPVSGQMRHFLLMNQEETRVSICRRPASGAKEALTEYQTLDTRNGLSLVECRLITGRMHQLRAQFAFVGTPILGDMTYGDKKKNICCRQEHQLLYAHEITFHFPPSSVLAYLDGKSIRVKHIPFLLKFQWKTNRRSPKCLKAENSSNM